MNLDSLRGLLEDLKGGRLQVAEVLARLADFPEHQLPYATIDTQRELRVGFPEVVYCEGKAPGQVRGILEVLLQGGAPILATRADSARYEAVRDLSPRLRYDPVSRTISLRPVTAPSYDASVAVVTAGTSDIPVAEEAAVTVEMFGLRALRVNDVGVAGLHRLTRRLPVLRSASAIVAVAGMEGALQSVLGGLVGVPVIAVPTSVGYGASFGGLAALLSMLTGCAAGVTVVNIDNGFGAGYMAGMIGRLAGSKAADDRAPGAKLDGT